MTKRYTVTGVAVRALRDRGVERPHPEQPLGDRHELEVAEADVVAAARLQGDLLGDRRLGVDLVGHGARALGVRSCTTYAISCPYVSGSLDAVMYACSSVRWSSRENGTKGRSSTNSVPSPDGRRTSCSTG